MLADIYKHEPGSCCILLPSLTYFLSDISVSNVVLGFQQGYITWNWDSTGIHSVVITRVRTAYTFTATEYSDYAVLQHLWYYNKQETPEKNSLTGAPNTDILSIIFQ